MPCAGPLEALTPPVEMRRLFVSQELILPVVLVPLGLWLGDSGIERALLVGSLLIIELLNSALENVVDRIGEEHHKLSGSAKDQGSSAVFFSLVLVVFVWGIVLAT